MAEKPDTSSKTFVKDKTRINKMLNKMDKICQKTEGYDQGKF